MRGAGFVPLITHHSSLLTFRGPTFCNPSLTMKRPLAFALTGTLAVLTLSTTGCGSVARALDIVNPRYSIQNIRPRVDIALPLSASTIDFDFDLGVDNPNSVGLRLDQVDFELFVNND